MPIATSYQDVLRRWFESTQYCSHDFQARLSKYGMLASMSGTGNCFDNAPMESFWHSLKVERVHDAGYETRAQAKQDVFSYIEMFYNIERRHSSLGYLSPRAFENRYWSEQNELFVQVPNKSFRKLDKITLSWHAV